MLDRWTATNQQASVVRVQQADEARRYSLQPYPARRRRPTSRKSQRPGDHVTSYTARVGWAPAMAGRVSSLRSSMSALGCIQGPAASGRARQGRAGDRTALIRRRRSHSFGPARSGVWTVAFGRRLSRPGVLAGRAPGEAGSSMATAGARSLPVATQTWWKPGPGMRARTSRPSWSFGLDLPS